MRILQIRFKNLNSLAGEWAIDLTHPAFAADGIFAITGPTGAGKTTVLDAVCLALYGRTPRLGKVTKSENEVLSRRTGECFAEVTFETQSGRYRCHWSQRRSRRRPDGELQAPKHEIARADSGEILDSRVKGVAEQIEAVTGMDFDRFTRSMLLAQGGFAAFLQADPDDRAPLLEQITGTEIYSRISVRVHERQREEREKLRLLEAETEGVTILGAEEEKAIGEALEAGMREEAELTARCSETGKAMAWLGAIEALEREIAGLDGEEAELRSALDAFGTDRERLAQALKAASLESACAALTAVRREQADDGAALTAGEAALPGWEPSVREGGEALLAAERRTAQAREALRAAAPVWQRVRSLDQRLEGLRRAAAESEADCAKDAAKNEADGQALSQERERRAEAVEVWEEIDGYLRTHARDEWLVGGLAGVEERLSALVLAQKEILRKEAGRQKAAEALARASQAREACRGQAALRRREMEEAAARVRQGEAALSALLGGRLLREYRTEKETLLREMAFRARIAELESYRDRLEDGKPCPLCGAAEHPYARGNVPLPDVLEDRIEALTQRIGEAEGREDALRQAGELEAAARHALAEAEGREASAAKDEENALRALADAAEALETLRADWEGRRAAVSETLRPLGVASPAEDAPVEGAPEADPGSLLCALKARLAAWQEQVRRRTDAERRIAGLDGEVKRLEAVVGAQSASLTAKRERLEAVRAELADEEEARRTLFGDRDPEGEERRLNAAISEAEEAERRARERRDELLQGWSAARAQVDALRERMARRAPELERLEAEFASALASAGFADEEQFLEAVLPAERRAALTARAAELDERRTELRARRSDREARLAAEAAKKVTDQAPEALASRLEEQEASLGSVRERVAGLRHRLNENAAARERMLARRAAAEAQRGECRRWDNLHDLIGSADGKKFRNFVQGLTFDLMIGQANRQLERMSDRYLLIRDDLRPLELNVIDNDQAGEIRSTKNLSGGESFIVSLALALGLSRMSSRNVRVDSLFLDEGFGTLDEDALDAALEALAGLRRDGKLIGVISHVPALKERIGTQIRVEPQTGGRSRLFGPGCTGDPDRR